MNPNSDSLPNLASNSDDRMWAMFCHLGTLVTWFPFANVILPLVIWMVKKDTSPFVNDQGKEALNFQITILIAYAVCIPLVFILIGIPAMAGLFLFHVVFSIVAAIKAFDGKAYRYPCTLRLVE